MHKDGTRFEKTVLKNGLRVISEHLPAVHSVALGVWIDVGSRNEHPEDNGICHFIEHMLFKGTKRRNAKELASALESLGGALNGFTSREQTCYHARFLDRHFDTAVDVLADMSSHPTLAPTHIAKEKGVVCEEIKETLDSPSDRIHDVFARAFWGKHPLGQPIMGSQENIKAMTRSRIVNFIKGNYRSESIVVAAAGSVDHKKLVETVKRKFKFTPGLGEPPQPAVHPNKRVVTHETDKNNQVHLCLGFPSIGYGSELRMAVLALSSYLGGGMSSVLFQKIREERGLAYSVFSFNDFYRDSGVFGAYIATDTKHVKKALAVILEETRRMKKKKLPSSQLAKVKSQMQGHLILGMESTNSRMNRIARQELMIGRYQTIDELIRDVDAITPNQILELSNLIFDEEKITVAALGPVQKNALDSAFKS